VSSLARRIRDRSMLLADPDPDTRALYRQLLSYTGWRLDEAEDGVDALAKARTQPPELLITETRLPLLDGYTLCELLRIDPVTAAIRILVVTGDALEIGHVGEYRPAAEPLIVEHLWDDIYATGWRACVSFWHSRPHIVGDGRTRADSCSESIQ
jgi:CheY-like chemotaxis protein